MTPRGCLDTNILLYSISTAEQEERKRQIARDLIDQDGWGLSVQVLQEFYVQATRAGRAHPLPHGIAAGLIRTWLRFQIQDVTAPVMVAALAIGEGTACPIGTRPSSPPRRPRARASSTART